MALVFRNPARVNSIPYDDLSDVRHLPPVYGDLLIGKSCRAPNDWIYGWCRLHQLKMDIGCLLVHRSQQPCCCPPLLPSVIGSSLGKFLLGIRYVDFHGNAVTIKQTLHKTAYGIGYFLILALPGPIIGFTMGMESMALSVLALFIAISGCFVFNNERSNGLVLSYRKKWIVPILKKNLASFNNEMALINPS
jgi:hypothetical protein